MRYVRYREGRGRADSTARGSLNELLMLTEASISLTNIQRWTQERVTEEALNNLEGGGRASIVPGTLRNSSKTAQYETEVVDTFLHISAQSFAYHGSEALWERPIRTGKRGRPISIDVSLFNAEKGEEARIEFGFYSKTKLRQDSDKLWQIQAAAVDNIPNMTVANFLILWQLSNGRASKETANQWLRQCNIDSRATAPAGAETLVRAASVQDLFSPTGGSGTQLRTSLFEVAPSVVS